MEPRSLTTAVPSSTCSALGPTRGTEALSTEKTKCGSKALGFIQDVILTCLIMSRCLLARVEVCSFRLLNQNKQIQVFRFLNQGIEIYLFCSFILFNWNTKDLGTLWGKVYYVIAPCFVNFLRTIRTNYGSNILVPKCPIQSKMLFSMIFSKMMFSQFVT